MSFRNISAWSIRNPIPPLVLFVALMAMGISAFLRMDVNQDPDVEFPMAQIMIAQPGAAPTELETQVTQKVEAAVRSLQGVDEVNSAAREGVSMTMVQFTIGTPIDRAVNDVRDAISNIRADLPDGILEPQITRMDTSDKPIAYFAVEATDMTLEQLSWFVDNDIAKQVRTISGLSGVFRGGGVSREIRVMLDPVKLQSLGVTAAQVNAQLRQTNVNAAGGRTEIAGAEQSVRVLGNALNAYQLGQTQIALSNGRAIKLADLAEVRDLYAEQRAVSLMNNRQVLSFGIQRSKGASDVTVFEEVEKELARIQQRYPKVKFTLLYTTVDYTKAQYHAAMTSMVEGAVLAVLVVFLFLRDWRATIISAIAIPLSAIPAFWFMDMMGFTLNTISLLALSLVAGVLVDDAIVEIENIVRHMRMGKSAYQASIDAADEIGLAVLATTMAIVAVFLPVGLMPGVSGQFFKNFGFTVVFAVLLSLGVARLITPMIAAYFLKAQGSQQHGEGPLMDVYMDLLRWSLRNRWKTIGIGVIALALTVLSFATLPFTFQPKMDYNNSQVKIELVPGATLSQSRAVAENVAHLLQQGAPEVIEAAFADIQTDKATIYLTLRKDRPVTSTEFERAWAPRLNQIADARITFQSQSGGFTGRDVTITLGGDNPAMLEKTAHQLVTELATLPSLRAPRFNGDLKRPEITIKPRLDLAASMGVTTAALSQTIRIATLGEIDQNTAKFSLLDRQIPIRVSLTEQSRADLSTIENLPVPTTSGGSVPLKTVAEIGFGEGPTVIQRTNQIRRATIGVDLAPGVVNSDAEKQIAELPTMKNLPDGIQRLKLGESKWQAEMLTNFIIAVVSGILLLLAVLVLLYHRIMPPFVNMGSLLLAPLGAGLALHLTNNPMSMPVMIGLLMLLGIVAKNSILMVDFALEEMNKGVDRTAAILDAGHKRAQPIMMTTVAMVAGMVPTALSLAGDSSFRAPLGITVIGGLIVSTLLTLVIVPAAFSLAIGFERRIGPLLSKHLTTGGDADATTAPQAAE
ncbi:efflux RND transporter permease subunit [Aquisediminimonas sediminicola]|uniref:efflux RND transporter permease subunit n=1 Tax=Alteraquisediminimonas sediminicola TaxID=2676787 RepID=UPI001C8E5C9D|nr:efflux RND transporter permease subunit [Aquisediminimonas sediminicola]